MSHNLSSLLSSNPVNNESVPAEIVRVKLLSLPEFYSAAVKHVEMSDRDGNCRTSEQIIDFKIAYEQTERRKAGRGPHRNNSNTNR